MTTPRRHIIRQIDQALGKRQLFWFGTRGDDARSLSDVPQFSGSFTFLNRYSRSPIPVSAAYEDIIHHRVDLDAWDIDDHLYDEATKQFRRTILSATATSSAIVPYRPYEFLSALEFAREETCENLGLFWAHQRAFEHKPWVETAAKRMGIPTLNWQYVADEEQHGVQALLSCGPVVVRPSRGSGGQGMAKVSTVEGLKSSWPEGQEFFASVSRYFADCISLNIGGVVWDDGITIHFPSAQLIGIPYLVSRDFGYCGNDYGLCKSLDGDVIDQIEDITRRLGQWMGHHGYRGAFGVDFMLDRGTVLFTEINPRFQGSTRTSSMMSARMDEPCLLVDHVAALLHVPVRHQRPLRELVAECPEVAQIVVHNTTGHEAIADVVSLSEALRESVGPVRAEVAAEAKIPLDIDAVAVCYTIDGTVTDTGYQLRPDMEETLTKTNIFQPRLSE